MDWEGIPVPTIEPTPEPVNTPATGAPTISGTAQVGETLTASTSGIADADGLTNVSYSYQWIRNEGTSDIDITGATDSSYTLVAADEGQTIKVKVSFTDDAENDERLTSAATGEVEARPNRPATGAPTISGTAQVGETLTADTLGIADLDGLTNVSYGYQWVRNDGNSDTDITDATDSSYTLVAADEGQTIKVKVSFTDDADNDETLTSAATGEMVARPNGPATGAPTISGTAQVGETLTASTSDIADADGLTNVSYGYQWIANDGTSDTDITGATDSSYVLAAADDGKTIKVRVSFADDEGNDESLTSAATATVAAVPNSPATGAPAVTGTAEVGETLTGSTSGIADADGLTNVSYGYQWIANDGTSDTDITDATDSSYTLVAADEGKTIKVRVSFTDDAANGETLTSTATEAVSFAVQQQTSNNPATGSPTISGTVQVGETLTTDTSGIADADGLTNVSYSYQWARNDGSTDTDITGAADSSYTLVDADEGQTIKVKVTFADDAGDEETLTSAATATVAARPNTPMTSAQDDTTAPTISSVDITSDPDTDIQTHGSYQGSHRPDDPFAKYWYRIGEQVTATVTFTENIAVTGAPQLRLNVGTSQKLAIFQSANGATAAFTYTITEGDSDTNGISFSPNGLTLQGGTIKDNADNDAALSYSAVPTLSTHKVDGIRPRIRGLTVISQWRQGFSPNDDVSDIGNEILIDAQFSEPVFGSTAGPPQVNLQIGNESRQADWDVPTRSYPDYVFSYFVQEGDWDSDGVSMSAGSVNLNGGYIKDAAGNDAILTYSAVTSERRVDGIRPFITSIAITSDPGTDQAYDEGDEIEITVTFNEPVYASYNNHIEIDIGGTPRQAVAPATTLPAPQEVPFTYTVQNGDHDSDGISIGANKLTSTHPFFHIRDAFSDWPGGNLAYMEHMALPAQTTHKVAHTSSENIPTTQNHAPTGQPAITGVAQKKRTLHANVSDIADLNGLYNATFTYQWIRDQNHADMNIPNATGSTYTLTSEDVGNRVKVQVSFTDDQYHYEVVTSAPTATVADAPNSPATGAPAISGTAQVDKTLAAVTSGISDDDGLTQVAYAYRWIRNDGTTDTDILGANTARYTLTNADQDKYIKVRVTFTDDEQNPEQLTSRQTEAVTAPLTLLEALTVSPGTLTPTFDNSTTRYNIPDVSNVDERITIMTRTKAGTTLTFVKANVGIRICQAPPCGPWSYYDFDNNEITPLTDADSHVDGFQIDLAMGDNMLMLQANTIHSIEYESYRFTITRAEEQEPSPNSPATGSPVISGSTNVGQTLTSSVSAISDDDGTTNTTFSYQWLSNRDTEIGGATSSTYTLVSADEGKTLKVRVTFTDDAGNEETLTSTATDAVTSPDQQQTPNTPARGTPTISGTSQVKQTLTANTSSIVDDDGLTNVAYSYQWITNDGNSDTDIAGETGITYTLIETDQGNTIKVQVAFTDDADNDESLTSQATAPVAAAAPTKPPGIPRNLTGTANADGTVTLTWDAPNNHSVTGYQILRRSPTLGEKKLLVYVDDTGTTATEYTDRNVVPDELYAYRIKAINAVGLSRQSQFISVTPTQPAEPAQNSPATGTPTISGILQVGETLTANTTGIADADGLTNVTYRYQWIPDDGSFDADNQAPPGSSYTLFEADEGKIIKLEVSFTDDAGNGESLTSAATAAVAARPNTPATGAPTISGTSQVAETLTANTSDIVDDDGLTNVAYSYQWITNDGSSDTDIAGETGITYTLVDTDEGKIIKLEVSFTDDAGNGESLTSAATAAVAARPNTPATGAPTISGTSQVTQTLTANTSDIVDDDGLTNVAYSYQWITNDGSSDTDIATGRDTSQVTQTLTANTSDIVDDDGLTNVAYSYQWITNDGHRRRDRYHLHPRRHRRGQDRQSTGCLHRRRGQRRESDQPSNCPSSCSSAHETARQST